MKWVIFLSLSLSILVVNAGIVSYIDPCHYSDSKCLLKSSRKAQPYIAPGDPKLGIPSLDPLVMPHVVNGDSENLNLKFFDMKITHLKDCTIEKIERPEKLKVFVEISCPFTASGKYDLKGKLTAFPAEGSGDFEIKTKNMHLTATINLKAVEKDGVEYYKFTGFDYSYKAVKKVEFIFHNLFNGDKVKAEPVQTLLNDNWEEMINGLGKPVMKEVITQIINSIGKMFAKIPRKELELD